jgi:hypothetical protein
MEKEKLIRAGGKTLNYLIIATLVGQTAILAYLIFVM